MREIEWLFLAIITGIMGALVGWTAKEGSTINQSMVSAIRRDQAKEEYYIEQVRQIKSIDATIQKGRETYGKN